MPDLVLRVEAGGRVLGEYLLEGRPLALHLHDAPTGRLLSTLTIAPGEPASTGRDLYRDETVDLAPREAEALLLALPAASPRRAAGGEPALQPSRVAAPSVPARFELPSDALVGSAGIGEGDAAGGGGDDAPFHGPDAEHEGTESQGVGLVAPDAPPSSPEHDRSITRSLPGPSFDIAFDGGAPEGRPTQTDPIPSEEYARPTYVDSPSADPDPDRPRAPRGSARSAGPTIVPTDFAEEDEAVTVVARPREGDVAQDPDSGGRSQGEYDEVPVNFRGGSAPGDDLSLGSVGGTTSHPGGPGAWDELPVPAREPGGIDDDLSLSLPFDPARTDAIDELSLHPVSEATSGFEGERSLSLPLPDGSLYGPADDDDLSLPVPESLRVEWSEPQVGENLMASSLGFPQVVPPKVDTTGGFERDQSTERLEGAEVWFRRSGEWTPRGALSLGQHVQAFGGMVRCDDRGGLVVLAGPRLHGSATLPSGELRQIQSGQQAVQLPAGTSVVLWQGEQGIYVRSNVPADVGGSLLDPGPVVYRRPPRSRSWKPPRSDLEEEGS